MTPRKPDPTPIELFLAPLATLARKHPEIEALVFWGSAEGWPQSPSEALESEEITFYAEGLLQDGFHLVWTVVALADVARSEVGLSEVGRTDATAMADHVRLHFWQDDSPPPPALPTGWTALETARWTAT